MIAHFVPSPKRTWIEVVGFDVSTSNVGALLLAAVVDAEAGAVPVDDPNPPGMAGVEDPDPVTSGTELPSLFPPPSNAFIGFFGGGL